MKYILELFAKQEDDLQYVKLVFDRGTRQGFLIDLKACQCLQTLPKQEIKYKQQFLFSYDYSDAFTDYLVFLKSEHKDILKTVDVGNEQWIMFDVLDTECETYNGKVGFIISKNEDIISNIALDVYEIG